MAILREQGVTLSHVEMAAAFDRAGFEATDIHIGDILTGQAVLEEYNGLVACGGFSYGDVLGAGGKFGLSQFICWFYSRPILKASSSAKIRSL